MNYSFAEKSFPRTRANSPAEFALRLRRAPALRAGQASAAAEVLRKDFSASIRSFRSLVWNYWKKNGRHDLPWRHTRDPYKILVSEVMLQQTQVSRVIQKYPEFLRTFPTIRTLSRASLREVLRVWSGMGYNRRAKFLRDAARVVVEQYGGRIPRDKEALRELPGVGPYTASAIHVFAWNESDILIETNIRTALIHHFSDIRVYETLKTLIPDQAILPIAKKAAEGQNPREWHWALMDYGAYLKKSGVRNNNRSAHYIKQSKFEGSLRQARGAILHSLSHDENIKGLRNHYKGLFTLALAALLRDGLVVKKKGEWKVS